MKGLSRPFLGVLVAIVITTSMDATGLSAFSALPLFPLLAIFWYLGRFSRLEIGLTLGKLRCYGLASLYPLIVLGLIAVIATTIGAADLAHSNWGKAAANLALVAFSTFVVAIITEEGFFRGWLWASLERAQLKPDTILILSSVAFSLWHLSAVTLHTGFDLPGSQVPIFMVNAAVIGFIWGLLRAISGSVVVTSWSHGLWNAGAYVLFGFGTKTGALGIKETAIYGPEVGLIGLGLNVTFAVVLWRWWRSRSPV